ncbi:MAG: hypothetical protein GTN86_01895 [Xanthomonadales bacterium]|nr:hypothetical protein [Xanthomonadales bacterium]NIO12422.1 hypothetical protein [Xanthomonadales bacterium]NIQ34685.1 hypothetical protein [Xanthomonadales bacterium]NIT07429.1 hypothetical protein [Xanthomonadales bacterium]
MEVLLGCNTATVSVLDAGYAEVVSFTDVPVHGTTGFCNESSIDPFDDKELFGQLINAGQ